ncbi:MAG: serine/threonine-protein phosphatase [FCB group bacterium]|nr:serine/threonine-protein phosphatase [FCB group bacterium]
MTHRTYQSYLATARGSHHSRIEDRGYCDDDLGAYAVADGIGGIGGGHVASDLAIKTFIREVKSLKSVSKPWSPEILNSLLVRINDAILNYGQEHSEYRGLGTTFTGVIVEHSSQWWLLHAGDSRLYCLEETGIRPLTTDQTLKTERQRMGLPADSAASREKHILTNYLGSSSFYPETSRFDPRPCSGLLLCTDGLCKSLEPNRLHTLVHAEMRSPENLCTHLIAEAKTAGSTDDITVIVIFPLSGS